MKLNRGFVVAAGLLVGLFVMGRRRERSEQAVQPPPAAPPASAPAQALPAAPAQEVSSASPGFPAPASPQETSAEPRLALEEVRRRADQAVAPLRDMLNLADAEGQKQACLRQAPTVSKLLASPPPNLDVGLASYLTSPLAVEAVCRRRYDPCEALASRPEERQRCRAGAAAALFIGSAVQGRPDRSACREVLLGRGLPESDLDRLCRRFGDDIASGGETFCRALGEGSPLPVSAAECRAIFAFRRGGEACAGSGPFFDAALCGDLASVFHAAKSSDESACGASSLCRALLGSRGACAGSRDFATGYCEAKAQASLSETQRAAMDAQSALAGLYADVGRRIGESPESERAAWREEQQRVGWLMARMRQWLKAGQGEGTVRMGGMPPGRPSRTGRGPAGRPPVKP